MNPSQTITAEDLEDGSLLEAAVSAFNKERTQDHLFDVLEILRDSYVWIPCTAVMSEEDQRYWDELAQKFGIMSIPSIFVVKDGKIVGKGRNRICNEEAHVFLLPLAIKNIRKGTPNRLVKMLTGNSEAAADLANISALHSKTPPSKPLSSMVPMRLSLVSSRAP